MVPKGIVSKEIRNKIASNFRNPPGVLNSELVENIYEYSAFKSN